MIPHTNYNRIAGNHKARDEHETLNIHLKYYTVLTIARTIHTHPKQKPSIFPKPKLISLKNCKLKSAYIPVIIRAMWNCFETVDFRLQPPFANFKRPIFAKMRNRRY